MIVESALPLAGIRVLVTRPEKQSGTLCNLIEENGGAALRLPTIELQPPVDPDSAEQLCKSLGEFQIALFVSRNAVDWAFDLFLNKTGIPDGLSIMAIGAGTARQIQQYGINDVRFIKGGANSEAFLELDELQADAVRGKRIIIFRGQGGREVLASELRERGALVEYAEVYRRVQPQYDKDFVHKTWIDEPPDVIVVTSNEGLQNLFNMTAADDHAFLLNTPLVLIGSRMSSLARQLGFNRTPAIARVTSDQGLLESIISTVGDENR
jgi:uroporphyrinogen-III synthase